jgi:hypothetical protein
MQKPNHRINTNYNLGAIIAIPLPDGRFAYAKIFRDYDFGVYDYISEQIEPAYEIIKHEIIFFQSATDSAVKSGDWPIIGEEPFQDDESSWGPPKAAGVLPGDGMSLVGPLLSYRGTLKNAKVEEVLGLEIEEFCQTPDLFIEVIVERLIKGEHDKYRVKA